MAGWRLARHPCRAAPYATPTLGRLGRGLKIKIKIKSQARLRAVRRSRLAGEEVRKTCIAWADAFAGKPAPTETHAPLASGRPAGRRRALDFDLDLSAPLTTMAERRH
ncbi:hypothetical protein FW796_30285 [Pseudomonas sp. 910_21]